MRAFQNLNQHKVGDTIDWDKIYADGFMPPGLKCPCGGKYIIKKTYPKKGSTVATCPHSESKDHHPKSTEHW